MASTKTSGTFDTLNIPANLANSTGAQVNQQSGKDRMSDDHASINDQAQTLLAALGNMIILIIRNAMSTSSLDLNSFSIGNKEGKEFLTALQVYIRSVVDSPSQTVSDGAIKVVDPKGMKQVATGEDIMDGAGLLQKMRAVTIPSPPLPEHGSYVSPSDGIMTFSEDTNTRQLVYSNLLKGVESRIFNNMPIRLLSFQKRNDGSLEISLLDRARIREYLTEKLWRKVASTASHDLWSLQNGDSDVWTLTDYAILSHTWMRSLDPGEVTYTDWHKGRFDMTHPGYQKLVNFCRIAIDDHGLELGWMDTVCIDKSSSSELDESIRSMYKWYQNASVCVAYLSGTTSVVDMVRDAWFTRGWTLQELLAPRRLKFYNKDWKQLTRSSPDDKKDQDIQRKIESATGIDGRSLMYFFTASFPRRMQWAAKRQVTRGEDSAYSLMGIFGVNMSIAYGEGAELAFLRLIREILNTPSTKIDILHLFNWGGDYGSNASSLLPSNPLAYFSCIEFPPSKIMSPLMLTHLGLRISVLLLPASLVSTPSQDPVAAFNNDYTPKGEFYAPPLAINLSDNELRMCDYENYFPQVHNILDNEAFESSSPSANKWVFTVLNCGGDDTYISVPSQCFAVLIEYSGDIVMTPSSNKRKMPTTHPITFLLRNKIRPAVGDFYSVKRSDLIRHGMQFLDMYF